MATKRIKDLTIIATALDLVSSRYGVLDTPNITKKIPGNLLVGGGGLFQFVPGTTTFSDILPALSESDGAFLATADGKKILAAAREEAREDA